MFLIFLSKIANLFFKQFQNKSEKTIFNNLNIFSLILNLLKDFF